MANTILHKRSSTASAVPAAGSLTAGELAINTADGKVFTKKDNGSVINIAPVTSVASKTGDVTLTKSDVGLSNVDNTSDATKFTNAALTGTPTAPTAAADTNTTQIATTAYVQGELTDRAPLASPALTGTPTAPTASANTNTTQIATTAYVQAELTAGDLEWAGAAYTVSTGTPSGGADGDFWFERVA